MPRVKSQKHAELESFWRYHHDEWARGRLNQREYCELHGLPLKRFGNWRALFKSEPVPRTPKLLYRRDGLRHMASHMSDREIQPISPGYIPSRSVPGGRRAFTDADKKRIVAEASRPGASISSVARRHGIGTRLLFRWKQELAAPEIEPQFLPVTIVDAPDQPATAPQMTSTPAAAPIIVERPVQEIEVELRGGRRVRFARDIDPETVRSLIAVLEGAASC